MKTSVLAIALTILLPVAFSIATLPDAPLLSGPASPASGQAAGSATYQLGSGEHRSLASDLGSATPIYPEAAGIVSSHGSTPASASAAVPGAGLIIDATFDSSITSNPNAAAIESTINEAISILQSLFSDPIRVSILFRYSTTEPNGTPIGNNFIAESFYVYYTPPWEIYINALVADAKTPNDSSANASLPSFALTPNIKPSSAGGRAVGLDTPPAMYADGSVAPGAPYDGIVTLNANVPLQFTRPPGSNYFDALRSIQHEIDEVLGLGSYLGRSGTDIRPQDLFSWSASGVRSRTASGSRYFSINSGNTSIVGFNQQPGYDYGDWYSAPCPQASPLVQNALSCPGQYSDVTATSPEGINLDVIGYDLASAIPVQVTVDSTPSGRSFTVDGAPYNSPQSFSWVYGSSHTLGTVSPQNGSEGVRYLWTAWSDGAGMSHNITATASRTYTASFQTQYYLTISAGSGGSTTTQSNWHFPGDHLSIAASPAAGYNFAGWQGSGNGSYSGKSNPAPIVFNGPLTEKATFAPKSSPTPTPSPTPAASPSGLQNISTRLNVRIGDNVLIGGFIITGTKPKKVMLRALGPSLPFAGTLPNPTLELHYPDGSFAPNDDWKVDVLSGGSQEAAIRTTGIPPSSDFESALIRTLSPGGYTAVVKGKTGGSGVGLIEVYDVGPAAPSRLANISSRGFIGIGNNLMIGGFIVGPATFAPSRVIIRALGPSVPVAGPLSDPTLELHDSNGVTIASNDNWQEDSSATELAADQLAPSDPRESAMARVLAPGAYTAIVAGSAGTTGVGLVEIYSAPQQKQ